MSVAFLRDGLRELTEDDLIVIAVNKLLEYVGDAVEYACKAAKNSLTGLGHAVVNYATYKQYLVGELGNEYYRFVSVFRMAWLDYAEEAVRLYDALHVVKYPDRWGLPRYAFDVLCGGDQA